MGDEDAAEALYGTGCVEDGATGPRLSGRGTRYGPRPAAGHKLDPYKEIIEEHLGRFPLSPESAMPTTLLTQSSGHTRGSPSTGGFRSRACRPYLLPRHDQD